MTTTEPKTPRDPRPLAGMVVQALYAFALAQGLLILSNLTEIKALSDLPPGAATALTDDIPTNPIQDLIIVGGGLIGLLAYAVAGFLVLKWMYRVNLNARIAAPDKQISAGWSIGWYFIPFASLYMPFKAMNETWRISEAPQAWRSAPTPSLLRWWWGLFLASSISDNAAARLSLTAKAAEQLILADQLSILGSALAVPLCLALIKVVQQVTSLQAERLSPRLGEIFS